MVVSCGRFIRNISEALNIAFRIHADTHIINIISIHQGKISLEDLSSFANYLQYENTLAALGGFEVLRAFVEMTAFP
jgi:hypothetical protein